jgi:hypothetical protein
MLTRRERPIFHGALATEAFFAFQKKLLAFTATLATFGTDISSQGNSPA